MAKKDSTTLLLVGLLVVLVVLLGVSFGTKGTTVLVQDTPVKFESTRKHPFDVFSDPYAPPERENPYLFGRDYSYQQVGILDKMGSMLPLFGRPSPNSSNRWEYYTMKDGLKLPVSMGGKACNSDTGCGEMLSGNGDGVDVLGIGAMKSFIYDTKQLRR
jgi:hypothetical protein